jgi:hypothetical protein
VTLEREDELGLLKGLLDAVGESGGKVVLIRGEAGIGERAVAPTSSSLDPSASSRLPRAGVCPATAGGTALANP